PFPTRRSSDLRAALLERVSALPGVERAAVTTRLPVQSTGTTTTTVVDEYMPAVGTLAVELPVAYVSPGYFETMGVPLRNGRTFQSTDHADAPVVAVVNEAAARLFWADGEAVGGRVRPQGAVDAGRQVVGVVGNVTVTDVTEAPRPMVYYSIDQLSLPVFNVVARTSGDPAALAEAMRRAVIDVRASILVTSQLALQEHVAR